MNKIAGKKASFLIMAMSEKLSGDNFNAPFGRDFNVKD
jgi:hypothetical protein